MSNLRIVRPIKGKTTFKKIAVVDTETWAADGPLAFGCYYSDTLEAVFYNRKELDKIILADKPEIIYTHFLEFDLIKIFDCEIMKIDREPMYAGGLLLMIKYKNIEFRDSYNLLRRKVSDIGSEIGLDKGILPEKFINPPCISKRYITKEDIKYCFLDCQVVFNALNSFYEIVQGQPLTVASAALRYFKLKHLKKPLYIKKELDLNFKLSYYGGRVEVFKLGKGNYKVFDINSLYPFVMVKKVFPHPNYLKTENKVNIKRFINLLDRFEGTATLTVYHKKNKYGYLPIKKDFKLLFPNGLISGSWNFPEIRKAINDNIIEIISIDSVTYSTKNLTDFFDSYVYELYNLKNKGGTTKIFYKFLLNGLYGKWAQNSYERRIYFYGKIEFDLAVKELKDNFSVVPTGNKQGYLIQKNYKETFHTCYSIGSYITSYARIELLNSLLENKKAVYCDTDSIAIPINEDFKGQINKHLGYWKQEDYNISNIYGNKHYDYIDKQNKTTTKIKGVKQSSILTYKDETIHKYDTDRFIKSKESNRRNLKIGSIIKFEKIINLEYTKRITKFDGNTEPIYYEK